MKNTITKMVKMLIAVFTIAFCMGTAVQGNVGLAASTFAEVQAKYPDGSTWNGSYEGRAWQCHGWALQVGKELTGSDPYTWARLYNLNSLKSGDIIRCSRPHTIIVTAVSGDTITYADCNWVGANKVKWNQSIQRSDITKKFGSLQHVLSCPGSVPNDSSENSDSNTAPVAGKAGFTSVAIAESAPDHITVSFGCNSNTQLVKVVVISKTTGQEIHQSYTSGLDSISYRFDASSMTNPGKDFYIRLYAYTSISGGGEELHAVTYNAEPGSVRLDDYPPICKVESLPNVIASKKELTGWAASDPTNPVTEVNLEIDGKSFSCKLFARSDVTAAYPQYQSGNQGFSYELTPAKLDNGDHTVRIMAKLKDGTSIEVASGSIKVIKLAYELFDWSWYYAMNAATDPNVKAIGHQPLKLYEYYLEYGTELGHIPSMTFSPAEYKRMNGDLAGLSNLDLYSHYVNYTLGQNEYRVTSEFLDLNYYRNENADLRHMSTIDLTSHFIRYGLKVEARLGRNNAASKAFLNLYSTKNYSSLNLDIRNAFGEGNTVESAESIFSQFCLYVIGNNDNRRTNTHFYFSRYKEKYGVANNYDVFWDYINSGYEKGRTGE